MKVTIRDVAKEANVSIATVSRVVNRKDNVSIEAVTAVNAAAKKLGYNTDLLARDLRNSDTRLILVIVPSVSRGFYTNVIAGMESEAGKNGYNLLIAPHDEDSAKELRYLKLLLSHSVDGAVLLAPKLDARAVSEFAESYNIAVCLERLEGCNALTVTTDNIRAGRDAIDYLIQKGNRKIGMISAVRRSQSSVDRENGYRQSLKSHNCLFKEEYIYRGECDYETGVSGCLYLLGLKPPPTAIFCVSDMQAIGAANTAAELGKRVGKDIMIIGFGNIAYSRMFRPHYLSSVEQPYFLLGATVMEKLLKNIPLLPAERDNGIHKLPHRLVLRETTNN